MNEIYPRPHITGAILRKGPLLEQSMLQNVKYWNVNALGAFDDSGAKMVPESKCVIKSRHPVHFRAHWFSLRYNLIRTKNTEKVKEIFLLWCYVIQK